MIDNNKNVCPHCKQPMSKWASPGESTWGEGTHYVCFNDDCPYYKRGWEWMKDKYNVNASYRHHYNPETNASDPIPVWDENALRNKIIE